MDGQRAEGTAGSWGPHAAGGGAASAVDGQCAEGTVGSWGPRAVGGGVAPLQTLAAPLGLTPVACVAVCPPSAWPCMARGTVPEDEPCLEAQLALLCGRAWTP